LGHPVQEHAQAKRTLRTKKEWKRRKNNQSARWKKIKFGIRWNVAHACCV